MKSTTFFVITLAILSAISGYMMSKVSLVGGIGMSLVYTQYSFLKVWWQGAALIFGVLLLFYILQSAIQQKAKRGAAITVNVIAIVIALAGLYLTYDDFRHFTHRMLGERFHIGVYLFWLGWMMVSLFLLSRRTAGNNPTVTGKKVSADH